MTWFSEIKLKNKQSFVNFDICDFYPSIDENVLTDALEFARKYTPITEDEKHIIGHSKKTRLFRNNTPWGIKKI